MPSPCETPGAAVTKYRKLGELEQHGSQFWRPSQGVSSAMLSLTALGESPSSSLLASRVCLDP